MLTLPLETARLRLRDFCADDADAYCRLRGGGAFGRHYAVHELSPGFSQGLLQQFIAQQQATPRRAWQLAITLADSGTLIGSVGLRHTSLAGEAQFGIELDQAYWGQGYAREAGAALLHAGFNTLGLHRVEADTHAANLPAQRLATGLGFVPSRQEGDRHILALALDLPGVLSERKLLGQTAQLRRHPGYWQLATPTQPDFFFGNLLLPDQAPLQREVWEARFDAAFAGHRGVQHRTLLWAMEDEDCAVRYQPWLDAGYQYMETIALLLTRDSLRPTLLPTGYTLRPLASDDDWQQWASLLASTRDPGHDEAGYRRFLRGLQQRYRQLEHGGHGHVWGVFASGQLQASAGLFTWQALGRFQMVATAPDARRQGLASGLISALAAWGLARVPRLVIVADAHYHAIDLYRKLGFVHASSEASLCWWPRPAETA